LIAWQQSPAALSESSAGDPEHRGGIHEQGPED
jgi:hypothetical protein